MTYGVKVRGEVLMTVGSLEVARRIMHYEQRSPLRWGHGMKTIPAVVVDLATGAMV